MREPIVPQLQGDEFLSWEARQRERYELHHGFVVAFAGGTLAHDTIGLNLAIAVRRCFPSPCRAFGSDVKIEITSSTYLYADAGVVCAPASDSTTILREPVVVCEVLSESTRTYDAIEKRAFYRSLPSLATYLIVDTRRRRIECDERYHSGAWQTAVYDEGDVPLGNGTVSLEEIYAGTALAARPGPDDAASFGTDGLP